MTHPIDEFFARLHGLANDLEKMSLQSDYVTCMTCTHFTEATELCALRGQRPPARIRRMSKRRQIIAIPKWQHRLTCAIQSALAPYMRLKTPKDVSDALSLKEWILGCSTSASLQRDRDGQCTTQS